MKDVCIDATPVINTNSVTLVLDIKRVHADHQQNVNQMFYLKVPADQMLPLMYLIDSICKNHGSPYKEMFNHNLVSNFAFIFQQVSEKVILDL